MVGPSPIKFPLSALPVILLIGDDFATRLSPGICRY